MRWIIQAQRWFKTEDGYTRSQQVPTFVLPELLGAMKVETAIAVATDIIGSDPEHCSIVAVQEQES